MEKAKALTQAVQLVVARRMQSTDVDAIWCKLDRIARYLNAQLSAELRDW